MKSFSNFLEAIVVGQNPLVYREKWGFEATGTVTEIIAFLKTQDPSHECTASVIIPQKEVGGWLPLPK